MRLFGSLDALDVDLMNPWSHWADWTSEVCQHPDYMSVNIRGSGKVVNAASTTGQPVLTCKVLQVQKTPIWLWMQIRKKKNQLKKTFPFSSFPRNVSSFLLSRCEPLNSVPNMTLCWCEAGRLRPSWDAMKNVVFWPGTSIWPSPISASTAHHIRSLLGRILKKMAHFWCSLLGQHNLTS